MAWNKGGCSKDNCTYKHETPSHVKEVANLARQEVVLLSVPVLPNQRGKARRFASFGSRDVVLEELIANSFMRVQWENQGELLLHVRPVATTKIKREIPRTRKGRDPEALAALRAPRARSPQSLKDLGPVLRSRHLPQFACCIHACIRVSGILYPSPRVVCPSIRFMIPPDVSLVKARGNLRPIGNAVTRGKVTFPWGHQFDVDQLAVNDAALTGTMLAGSVPIVFGELNANVPYLCDTDFGCNECIS